MPKPSRAETELYRPTVSGREVGEVSPPPSPFSHMWNLYSFYPDLTGVYATHHRLESFDHVLYHPIDGMRRRDQCVVDRQCRDAITVRRSESAEYQFAINAHQAHAGI